MLGKYLVFLLLGFTLCQLAEIQTLEQDYQQEKFEIQIFAADPAKQKEFSGFLNNLYSSSDSAILSKCSVQYSPEANSHETFITQFKKMTDNVNTILTKKVFKEINGEKCSYNPDDKNDFTSAKKAKIDVPTKQIFTDLLLKSSFGKIILQFSKCIGIPALNKISDPSYIEELFFMIGSEPNLSKLFESICSINNMFNLLKAGMSSQNPFESMGQILNNLLVEVRAHYNFIKNPKFLTMLYE